MSDLESTATTCPVCGSEPGRPGFRAKNRLIVTCGECHLQFIDPLTPSAVSDALEKVGDAFVKTYIRERASYETYFRSKVRDLLDLAPPGRLLDVGCAAGTFLQEASRAGFPATGVDLLPPAVEYARDELGVDARLGSVEELALSADEFDVVTLFQMIEHAPEPASSVKEVARILKPGGLLLVTTPDRHGFFAQVMGRRWFEYYNEEHLTFFDERSLRRLLAAAGFTVLHLRTEFGRAITMRYVAERLSDFYYTDTSLLSRGGRMLASLLRAAGGVPLKEPWQSLYAIARLESDGTSTAAAGPL